MDNIDIDAEVQKVEQLINFDPYSAWYDEDQSWTNGVQAAGVESIPVLEEEK